jgi:predicted DNA-binding transcriptional regulator YafY
MFTREEAGALFIGGEFAERLTDLSLKGHVRSALLKIRAVLPLEEKGYLERLQESTAVITRNDLSDRELGQCLATLQDAVVHRKGARIIYHTNYRDSVDEREIEPLGLVYYGDNWHLIAFCRLRHDIRDFRLDRVQHLELTGETFPERRGFSLREYLADANRSAGLEEVRVRFTREAARHTNARHMFGFVEQIETPDGVEMLFFTSSLQWIAQWILSYGTNAMALYPEELRCLTHSLALAVAGQYGSGEPVSSLQEAG